MTPDQLAYHRQWRKKNASKVAASCRKYRTAHRDERLQKQRERYAANREAERARHRENKRKRRALEPGALRDQYKEWRHRNLEKQILRQARTRAKKHGLEFDLTVEDIFVPETCPILGIALVKPSDRKADVHGFLPDSPSLDRIDSSRGYVRGNVWVISWRANRLKSDATLEELELLVAALRTRRLQRDPQRPEGPRICTGTGSPA